jgi:hypothetical protein
MYGPMNVKLSVGHIAALVNAVTKFRDSQNAGDFFE